MATIGEQPRRNEGAQRPTRAVKDPLALRQALRRGELRLFYQPILRVADGSVAGFEALLRWEHPELGMLPARDFLGAAHGGDLWSRLSEWVVYEACSQARTLADAGLGGAGFLMSVNLSARQLGHPHLAGVVADVMEDTGMEPERLCFEVAEATVLAGAGYAVAPLNHLRGLGVQLAIDDSGARHSSVVLAGLPVSIVKIDGSVVETLGDAAGDDGLVPSILELSHRLQRRVVAEGVERVGQVGSLRRLHCDLAQGNQLGPPVDAGSIPAFLDSLAPAVPTG